MTDFKSKMINAAIEAGLQPESANFEESVAEVVAGMIDGDVALPGGIASRATTADEATPGEALDLRIEAVEAAVGVVSPPPLTSWVVPGTSYSTDGASPLDPDVIYYMPIRLDQSMTFDAVGMPQGASWAVDKVVRMALYEADSSWQPGALVQDFGEMHSPDTTGRSLAISPSLTLAAGEYLLALVHNDDGGGVVADYPNCIPPFGMTYPNADINQYPTTKLSALTVSSTYGAFSDPGTPWDTSLDTSTTQADGFMYPVLLERVIA